MIDLYKVYSVVLSVLISSEIAVTQDSSICNFTTKRVPPPPPKLAPSYSATIEWKDLNTDSTIIVNEYFDGIQKIGSQEIYMDQQYRKVVYDYTENQYLEYTQDDGCKVRDLGSFTFVDNKIWISALDVLYGVVTKSIPVFIDTTKVRNVTVSHWQTCIYIAGSEITAQIDIYFTKNWTMAHSSSQDFSPVRFEIFGSITKPDVNASTFNVVGDFIDFNPQPDLDELQIHMQLPAGVFCNGRKSSMPLVPLSKEFSILFEIVDNTDHSITYEHVWYNSKKRLIRRDYKKSANTDPDTTMEIFDFNLGVHYTMDPDVGRCGQEQLLSLQDRYVAPNGNGTIRMMSVLEFFHLKNSQIQYVGYRTTRGVLCDVWVGTYLDPDTNINNTVEWYFNKKYSEAIGGTIGYSSLTRMDIWKGPAKQPVVRNVLEFDGEAPTQDLFSVGLCYKTQRIRVLIHLKVISGSLGTVSDKYLKDTLHVKLTDLALLPALRMADVTVFQTVTSDLYFDGSLLEKAPFVSNKIVPKPLVQHELNTAFSFLRGRLSSQPQIVISNATKPPLVVQALATRQLDYIAEFSTAPPLTTTPQQTPPTPELIPTTVKQIVPTTYETPGMQTPSAPPSNVPQSAGCTCPKPSCPTTKPINCPTVQPSTHCTCPTTTCPTPVAINCPTPAPCPMLTCPPPKACTPKACPPKPVCSPCPPCVQSTVKCPSLTSTITSWTTKPKPSPCTPKACPPQTNCSACPPCAQSTVKCPSTISSSTTKQSLPSTSTSKPQKPQQQTGDKKSSSGISSGGAAGLAVGMIVVGGFLGVGLLRLFQTLRKRRKDPESKTIFDKYLTDESNY